jgi:hypothetical protein
VESLVVVAVWVVVDDIFTLGGEEEGELFEIDE